MHAMTAIAFDIHQTVRRLEAAGPDRDALAAKADLAGLRADFAGLEASMYRASWIQDRVIPTALRFPPLRSCAGGYDFSQAKQGGAAGEQQRRPERAAEGCAVRSARVSVTHLYPEAVTAPKWGSGGGSPP